MKIQHTIHRSLLLAALTLPATLTQLQAQTRIDLRAWQTPLKNQGNRFTCTSFAAVAALESAYKRAGYGNLDLSEEFANYVVRMMLVHPNWDDTHKNTYGQKIGKLTANHRENTPGSYGGGYGTAIAKRFRYIPIPAEGYMPYQWTEYNMRPYGDMKWQHNTNAFNLDLKNLPRRALTAPAYYGVNSVIELTGAQSRSTAKMEQLLKLGFPVMWTFSVAGETGTNAIWQPSSRGSRGGHAGLICGYDRRSRNPRDHYFIVKNSWGSQGASRSEGGYTRVSYAYLRAYGSSAGYITSIKRPAAWPELAFLGRRNISYDGWRGTLDIWRVPGASRGHFAEVGLNIPDRRLGSFIDHRGVVHRVNGELRGNRMVFWFNTKKPNIRWDELRPQDGSQRRFVYYMVDSRTGEIAGTHHSNAGTTTSLAYGGYARVPSTPLGTNGFLRPRPNSSINRPEHFLGKWWVRFDGLSGTLNVNFRNDAVLLSQLRRTYAGLECEFVETNGRRHKVIGYVWKSRPARMWFSFRHSTRGTISPTVYKHSWERGVFSGTASTTRGTQGIYAYRFGESLIPGKLSYIGLSCRGSNARYLSHSVTGRPYPNERLQYSVANALPRAAALLVTGADLNARGVNLSFLGARNCFLYTTPYSMWSLTCDSLGRATFTWTVPNDRAAVGVEFTTQYATADARQNRLGLVTSNAYRTKLGGYR